MKVRISRAVIEAIRRQARAALPDECCGLMLATEETGRVDAILPAANVAQTPRSRFEVDPAVLIAAHRAERAGGPKILGCYHSHPVGEPVPSREDAAQADPSGQLWLICGGATLHARLWIARAGGTLHERFDPAEIVEY